MSPMHPPTGPAAAARADRYRRVVAAARFRIGPGTAIAFGVCMALLSIWATGGDPGPGEHKMSVLALRVVMVVAALSIHEWAHAAVAYLLGDTTARDEGRLTIDPRSHFDAIGLLAVPGILSIIGAPVQIGWAKPVPVNFSRLRRPRSGMAFVAAAGPVANLMLALASASLLRLLHVDGGASLAGSAAWTFAVTNLCLGIFNLLPLYPMDGGRIASCFLPERARFWLMRREGAAALVTLGLLLAVPSACHLFGVGDGAFDSLSKGLGKACDMLAGSGDNWYRPMDVWTSQ